MWSCSKALQFRGTGVEGFGAVKFLYIGYMIATLITTSKYTLGMASLQVRPTSSKLNF